MCSSKHFINIKNDPKLELCAYVFRKTKRRSAHCLVYWACKSHLSCAIQSLHGQLFLRPHFPRRISSIHLVKDEMLFQGYLGLWVFYVIYLQYKSKIYFDGNTVREIEIFHVDIQKDGQHGNWQNFYN